MVQISLVGYFDNFLMEKKTIYVKLYLNAAAIAKVMAGTEF